MRNKVLNLMFLSVFFFPVLVLAADSSNVPSDKAAVEKPLSSKDISTQMAEVWCKKMEECAKTNEMSAQECRKVMFKSFKTGFDNLPKGRKVEVMPPTMDRCVQNIHKGSCQTLKGAQNIPGCEFIRELDSQG